MSAVPFAPSPMLSFSPFNAPLSRREFIAGGAKLGAALLTAPHLARGVVEASPGQTLNVALIGCGEQGRVLINAALKIPGIRFRAVCDLWPYHRTYGERLLKGSPKNHFSAN